MSIRYSRTTTVLSFQRRLEKRLKTIENLIAYKKRELKEVNKVMRLLKDVPEGKHKQILKAIGYK